MKKLLSVLAAVGLTVTASTAVVACGTEKVAEAGDVTIKDGKAAFQIDLTFKEGFAVHETEGGYLIEPAKGDEKHGEGFMLCSLKPGDLTGDKVKSEGNDHDDVHDGFADMVETKFFVKASDLNASDLKDAKGGEDTYKVLKADKKLNTTIIFSVDGLKAGNYDWTLTYVSYDISVKDGEKNAEITSAKVSNKVEVKFEIKKAADDTKNNNGEDTPTFAKSTIMNFAK